MLIRPILILLAAASCSNAEQPAAQLFDVSGRLEDSDIREASGMARSQREPGLLWIINDNGAKEIVHATDKTGSQLGQFKLQKSRNKDWEDLASFRLGNMPYLMIADIGENDAKHDERTLYFVEEPPLEKKGKSKLDWRVDYVYPDGARDAESAAVDIDGQRALILSKRDIPPQLYSVPLLVDSDDTVTATLLGTVNSLQRPSRSDIEYASKAKDWYWQPVGMDISEDNLAAVILTYREVYFFQRKADQNWLQALNSQPVRISLGNFKNAESIAFGNDEREVLVTGETKNSRILRVDLGGVTTE
jgi:hypothetical protein